MWIIVVWIVRHHTAPDRRLKHKVARAAIRGNENIVAENSVQAHVPRHAERPRTPSNVDATPSQCSADGAERRARRDMSQRPTRVVRSWCPRPGAQRSGAVTCGVRTYAEQVAAAAMSRHASSQRLARTVDPYNATADVCQRDKSVVIRARRAPTNAAPRHPTPWRRSGTPPLSFPCLPVTAPGIPAPRRFGRPRSLESGSSTPPGCPARRRFRRENRVSRGQIGAIFETKFRASPPASLPPSFGLVRSARPKATPMFRG